MNICLYFRTLVLLCVLAVAAVTDTVSHKICNRLTATGFLFILLSYLVGRPEADPVAVGYGLMFIFTLILFFVLRMLGGADVKLYMLILFAFPNRQGLNVMILSVLLCAVWPFLQAAGGIAAGGRISGALIYARQPIPMGLFIFAASCLTLLA